ncbi:geranylgeranyl reductase family protein [Micrococcus sp.]|uniref:geranylgeranyl reductase family protein n=1 Tax=Micrococcus sp. TaxID=1271 RepID=UPI0026DB00CE|nr:geranylgeranyl reductase family protein [Micrococcus sp.]MDO4240459.1 geranylgeranyl reductase family protein [Micrococcus sp.]
MTEHPAPEAAAHGAAPARPRRADVLISGAGPAGATAAAHLAAAGLDVVVLEKSAFPREKVCGDGLTPQAVQEIRNLGIEHRGGPDDDGGWQVIRGLRLRAGERSVDVPWPTTASWPDYALTRTRRDFDAILADTARARGATVLERHAVTGVTRDVAGRVDGLTAELISENGRKTGETVTWHAPIVLACDGVSARAAVSMDVHRRTDRPMGVAVRAYYTAGAPGEDGAAPALPGDRAEWMESWLRLPDAEGNPLPGYGWLFPLADGTVNVGLGILDTSPQFGKLDYRRLLRDWTGALEADWGISEQTRTSRILGAALPMAFNRTPQHVPGMLLVGDAAGMVSPFNGEGIGFAMEAARIAAELSVEALAAGSPAAADAVLSRYPVITQHLWGRHFRLGVQFAQLIGRPRVMRAALATGMAVPPLLRTVARVMGNVVDPAGGDAVDRAVRILESVTPSLTTADAPRPGRLDR